LEVRTTVGQGLTGIGMQGVTVEKVSIMTCVS
jgi:hypothetical protein